MAEARGRPALHELIGSASALAESVENDPTNPALAAAVHELDQVMETTLPVEPVFCRQTDELRARCLLSMGRLLLTVRNYAAAHSRLERAVRCYADLASSDEFTHGPTLAGARCSLSASLNLLRRCAQGLEQATLACRWYRDREGKNGQEHSLGHAWALHLIGQALGIQGRSQEAADVTREAVEIRRSHAAPTRAGQQVDLAASLGNMALWLDDLGQHHEALRYTEQALDLLRQVSHASPHRVRHHLARELNNLGTLLSGLGRHGEALAATIESLDYRRAAHKRNPTATACAELASSLHNVGAMLFELERFGEALIVTREAAELRQVLFGADPKAFRLLLASSRLNEGAGLEALGQLAEGLQSMLAAMALMREAGPTDFADLDVLAMSCCDASRMLCRLGRMEEAEQLARESVSRYRDLATAAPVAFDLRLATSLNQLAESLAMQGRHLESKRLWRESAHVLMSLVQEDPKAWCQQVLIAARPLDSPTDLDDIMRRLLWDLNERRELAHDAAHAERYLALRSDLVELAWERLLRLAPDSSEVLDTLAPAIVAVLHSPDIARWISESPEGDPALGSLRTLRREVIAADRLVAEQSARRRAGEDIDDQIRAAVEHSAIARARYRSARAALLDKVSAGTSFDLPSLGDLRTCVAPTTRPGSMRQLLLCLMTVGQAGGAKAVGLMVDGSGQLPVLIEFPGLTELAGVFARHSTECNGDRRTMRRSGRSTSATRPADSDASLGRLSAAMAELSRLLADPLLAASGLSPRTIAEGLILHVCTHGVLQQLPLGGAFEGWAGPSVHVVHWPGFPYLRLATSTAGHKRRYSGWLVSHDCAWDVAPLPMVAVEAHLLETLAGRRLSRSTARDRRPVGGKLAWIVCGHGDRSAHVEDSIGIGGQSLGLERLVEERLSPRLAVLPMCFAGEVTEDTAGNAFGVAAAVLLGGARMVIASSKAVDDLLIPWFTTLLLWHLESGKRIPVSRRAAVRLAMRQFADAEFPPAFRAWLARALPAALSLIQPGGAEWSRLLDAVGSAQAATELLVGRLEAWPWAMRSDVEQLFASDAQMRQAATQALVDGILVPSPARSAEVRARLRELASFLFVYGDD